MLRALPAELTVTPLALARRAHGEAEGDDQVTQARSLLGLGLAARLGLARLGRDLLDDLLLGLLLRGGGNQLTRGW